MAEGTGEREGPSETGLGQEAVSNLKEAKTVTDGLSTIDRAQLLQILRDEERTKGEQHGPNGGGPSGRRASEGRTSKHGPNTGAGEPRP